MRNSRTLVGMLLVGCRQKATEFYLFRKCESYERYKTFVCTNKVICQFNPERLPEILVTRIAVSLFNSVFLLASLHLQSINQSINQSIYLCHDVGLGCPEYPSRKLISLLERKKKNRQKSLNSKVEEMQKRSSKIPEEFNMQEGALMPEGRYSLNWPRGEARPSGFRSFRYTKALGFH